MEKIKRTTQENMPKKGEAQIMEMVEICVKLVEDGPDDNVTVAVGRGSIGFAIAEAVGFLRKRLATVRLGMEAVMGKREERGWKEWGEEREKGMGLLLFTQK